MLDVLCPYLEGRKALSRIETSRFSLVRTRVSPGVLSRCAPHRLRPPRPGREEGLRSERHQQTGGSKGFRCRPSPISSIAPIRKSFDPLADFFRFSPCRFCKASLLIRSFTARIPFYSSGLFVGLDGTRTQPADARDGIGRVESAGHEISSENDAGAAQAGTTVDGHTHLALVGS